jgi:ADP-heptose:LPS heptosyltransferase
VDKKALVVRLSSLGDVVLSSCIIEPLRDMGYHPHLLTFEPYGEIFEDDRRINVIQVKKEELFQENTIKKLEGFDLYLDLQKNLKTIFLRLFIRGSWKSYNKQSIRRRLAVYIKAFRKPYHVIDAYLETIGHKGFRPNIEISEERLRVWKEKLGNNFVCIAPGARYKKKRYPYFKQVADLLEKEGVKVVLVGDTKDRLLTEGFEGVNLCGELSLVDTLAVIKLARAFVGNDSGLLHVARAVGTKAVQIYGGTHPTLGFSLYPDEGIVLLKNLECQPCDPHGKGHCKLKTYECLQIHPQTVTSAVLTLIR